MSGSGKVPTGIRRGVELARLAQGVASLRRSTEAEDRSRARAYLTAALGNLKGLPQKLGQIMSLTESLEDGEDAVFTELARSSQHPLRFPVIRLQVEKSLGVKLEEAFQSFSPEPLAVASLSQVHRARLQDGREVAVKVQFPAIASAIESDLRMLGWLGPLSPAKAMGFRMSEYRDTILRQLREELDFSAEACRIAEFRNIYRDFSDVIIPGPMPELSSENVLTLSFEPGEDLRAVRANWSTDQRKSLGENLLRLTLTQLLDQGIFHADPHPGNYAFRMTPRPSIVLYDFGCIRSLSPRARQALTELIFAVRRGRDVNWLGLLCELGFEEARLSPLADRLGALFAILLEPFGDERPFDLRTWDRRSRVSQLLGADQWAIRTSAPAEFIFVMRVFQGLIHHVRELGVPICWSQILDETLPDPGYRPVQHSSRMRTDTAQHLQIQVTEENEERVRLFLPADAALRLSEVIPDEVLHKLDSQGFDLRKLQNRLREQPVLLAETLFTLSEGTKKVTVRLV